MRHGTTNLLAALNIASGRTPRSKGAGPARGLQDPADAPNMKRPGADLIAHYLDPARTLLGRAAWAAVQIGVNARIAVRQLDDLGRARRPGHERHGRFKVR